MKPGDKVRMTRAGIEAGLDVPGKKRVGTVLEVINWGEVVRVKRDGAKNSGYWSAKFWRKVK